MDTASLDCLRHVVNSTNLTNVKSYLTTLENTVSDLSSIESPYSASILEYCLITKDNVENFICNFEQNKVFDLSKKVQQSEHEGFTYHQGSFGSGYAPMWILW